MENVKNKLEETVKRQSNFELFRIILMLMIIVHHYVVNSGLESLYDYNNITGNMIFLQLIGFAGKTCINCFVFITGYFMIKSTFKWSKWMKLCLEVEFYSIIIYLIFVIFGYETFSIAGFVRAVCVLIVEAGDGFTGTFIVLYLLIPFLNACLLNLDKKRHGMLIGILVFYYSIISTFTIYVDTYSNLGWMITTYIIGAYIGLYPCKWFESKRINLIGTAVSVFLSWFSILVVDFFGSKMGFLSYYHMLSREHRFLALTNAVFLFLVFKNLEIKYNKWINLLAQSTFGVLLIHANSNTMRIFLWKTVFDNTSFYDSPFLAMHLLFATVLVYLICVMIDRLRIIIFERYLFKS